jgi:replicative DNA helicase
MGRLEEENLISKVFYSYGAELHLVSSLQGKEFSEPHLGEIWEGIKETYKANWSYVELFSLKLSAKARETLGSISIMEFPISTLYLAETIRGEAKLHLGKKLGDLSSSITLENKQARLLEIKELTALLEAPITFETGRSQTARTIDFLNSLQRDPEFIPTHSPALNEYIDGLHKGNFIVLAARPSVGKTAVALNLAWGLKGKAKVAFYSLEMTEAEILRRLSSLETGLPLKQIKQKAGYEVSTKLAQDFLPVFETSGLEIVTNPQGFTMAELRSHALKLKQEGKLEVLILDQLDKIRASGRLASATEYEILTKHSTALKQLALELEVPIILLAQINREGNEEPTLKHLKGSGQLEQDADLVFILHRKTDQQDRETELSFSIAKNRQGETGKIFYKWQGEQMRLVEPKVFGWNKPDPNPAKTALDLAKTYDHQATFGTAITF